MVPPWLLSAALRGALVAALSLLTLVPLRRASASLRHGVLALALAALASLPLASALLPTWRVGLGAWPEAVSGLVVDESAPPPPEAAAAAPVASPVAAPTPPTAAPPAPARPSPLRRHALTLGWAAGALLCLLRLVGAQTKAHAVVRRARPLDDATWASDVERASRQASLRAPRVLVSREVSGPAVAGLFRPALLLPPPALTWNEPLRRAVLLHEFAHLRRRDLWTNLLAGVVRALHWFDPLVWALGRRLHHERELAADAFALRAGVVPSSYAESLLAVAAPGRGPDALLAMAQRPLLSRRIEAALGPRAGAMASPLARITLLALGAPLAAALACASPDASAPRSTVERGPAPRVLSASGAPSELGSSPRTGSTLDAPSALGPSPRTAAASLAPLHAEPSPPLASPPGARLATIARALGVEASQLELTLDDSLQRAAEEEIERLTAQHAATALSVVIMSPADGAVLALAGRSPRAGEEVAVERAYVHGSTMKLVTVAAALEEGTLSEGDKIAYGGGQHDLRELIASSSNEGASVIVRRLGADALARWQRRFHFGERPSAEAVPFPDAAAGTLPDAEAQRDGLSLAAIGAGLSASALHLASAYAAMANGGVYHPPSIVRRVRDAAGQTTWEHRPAGERLLRPATAHALLRLMGAVVESPRGTGRAARVEGARVGGKTGTVEPADSHDTRGPYASFVGVAPLESPRYVIAVGIEGARGSGGELAAPAFARLAARALSLASAAP
ncbi:MAG: penicillin-binding transpeptidase domain-containing protein [Polyangiaceae bacterium]|nr:penicillin-binding transpeptidase domain-containing protein [Polyangiaceae bacterium]